MKVTRYFPPKSSFLSIEKDMGIITNTILKNEDLKKLLHYTTKDCLDLPDLTEEQSLALFNKNIKIVPKLYVDTSVLNYIIIKFNNFLPNETNPEFRDNLIEFDIMCHFDQWRLGDFKLRPYRIAAELDTMFNNQHLTGIGTLQFVGADQILTTEEYAGVCLLYEAIHGEEDKVNAPNPIDEERLKNNFNKIFNA